MVHYLLKHPVYVRNFSMKLSFEHKFSFKFVIGQGNKCETDFHANIKKDKFQHIFLVGGKLNHVENMFIQPIFEC